MHIQPNLIPLLLKRPLEYALNQWLTLRVHPGDGSVEINNLVENAIRPTALGKKNWLFIGEAEAGKRGAILYTPIESSKRRGLEPYAYLREVLARLPHLTNHQIKDITPAAWVKVHLHLQQQAS